MQHNVLIDPHALLIDVELINQEKVESLLDGLIEIEALSEIKILNPIISQGILQFIDQFMDFPLWEKIDNLLISNDLQYFYHAGDIKSAFDNILKYQDIESLVLIEEILYQLNSFEIQGKDYTSFEKIEEIEKLSIYASLIKKITGTVDIFSNEEYSIECSYNLIEIDSKREDINIPYSDILKIQTVNSLEGIEQNLECIHCWKLMKDSGSFILANDILLVYLKQNSIDILNNFEFGFEFFEWCTKNGFLNEEIKIKMLFRALSEVIGGTSMDKTHSLRRNSKGGSPQIIRGSYKAYRHDIDRDYHLHYWKKGNNVIFASIGPHNQFYIPDPN